MKKVLSAILIICTLFTGICAFAPAEAATTHGYLLGDADDSGNVNVKDILLTRKYVAGVCAERDINLSGADANLSGGVDMKDILLIRRAVAGIQTLGDNNSDGLYRVNILSIGGRNISRYKIVIDSNDERTEYAAGELAKYVKRACGVALNIAYKESNVTEYKIEYSYDVENKLALGAEGYRICIEDSGDLSLYCGTLRGPLYATYFLLEQFGWRFLAAGKDWNGEDFEYIYKTDCADLPKGFDTTETPVFNYRAIGMGGCTGDNFAALRANAVDASGSGRTSSKKGGGEGALYIHGHSFAYFMMDPSDRYKNTTLEQYSKGQPCLTTEDTFRRMYLHATDLIEERKTWGGTGQKFGVDYTQISCAPNDNTNFCTCTECKRIYEIEGSIGGTLFRFVNRMAEALDEYCPGIEVFTIAHWEARKPTLMTRPYDNVIVCFRLGGCNNHSFLESDKCDACGGNPRLTDEVGNPLNNSKDKALYEAWCELSPNVYAWYCSDNLSYYIASSPNLFNIYDDFKYMAQVGTRGIYCEGSDTPYYTFEGLRGYLISKMMWDPFMSEEEFNGYIDEYLEIWYGEGSEFVREYIELENAASDELGCFRNNFDRPWNLYNEEFFKENYESLRALLEKAWNAGDSTEKKRVELLLLHVDFFGLSATFERDYENGDESSRAAYAERYKGLVEGFDRFDIKMTNWSDKPHAAENFPSSADDIYNPMSWITENYSGYWEWNGSSWV